MKFLKYIIGAAPVVGMLFFAGQAAAATIFTVPADQSVSVGQEVSVRFLIDSGESSVNAAQAVIRFPKSILNFVSVDRNRSVFGFWVEDPIAANGSLSFIGGTADGVSGKELQIFTAKFKAVGAGKAEFSIGDAIVTAADGKGTNILTSAKGGVINVSSSGSPAVAAPAAQEQPAVVNRVPVKASKLPAAPLLKVNLYPNPEKWYGQKGETIVLWDIPEDVTQVAASLDQNPKGIPANFEKQLTTGKNLGEINNEGVWYIHVRFKNSVGNGPVANYRVAVDRTSPPAFGVVSVYGVETDNPQPILRYSAKDSLSGIEKYIIHIGSVDAVETTSEEIKLPVLSPGKAEISVIAIDRAGNSTTASVNLNILPLPLPAITYVSKDVFAGEGGLIVRGTSEKAVLISVVIRDGSKGIAANGIASADASGRWEVLIDQPLKKGRYVVEAVSQDARGARSFPAVSEPFRVRVAPLLTIFGVGITPAWFIFGLLVVICFGFVSGIAARHLWMARFGRKLIIAQRDVVNVFDVLKKDVEKALGSYKDKKISSTDVAEMEFLLKKIKSNIEKMQKYIVQSIREISD